MASEHTGRGSSVAAAAMLIDQPRAGGFRRLSVALIAVSCMLTLVIGRPSASFGATVPRCSSSNLTFEFVRELGATSHRFWDLALRNVGPANCRLKGYPKVGLLDGNANLMSVSVVRRTGVTVPNVTLHPWHRAFFTFSFVVSGPCPSGIFPFGLQVFPPNSAQRLRMYRKFDVCAGSQPQVTPVRPGL